MDSKARLIEEMRLSRLDGIERDAGAWDALVARLEGGASPEDVAAELKALLARSHSAPENALRAARVARAEMDDELSDEDRKGLDELEARVASLDVGPSRLKIELYNHAHRLGRHLLLEETWFQELLDRAETRALLDTTEAG